MRERAIVPAVPGVAGSTGRREPNFRKCCAVEDLYIFLFCCGRLVERERSKFCSLFCTKYSRKVIVLEEREINLMRKQKQNTFSNYTNSENT